jgi:hypothetical protein
MNEAERCKSLRAHPIGSMSELAENGLGREATHRGDHQTGFLTAN